MKPSKIMKEHGAWIGLGEVLDEKCISKEQHKKELKAFAKSIIDFVWDNNMICEHNCHIQVEKFIKQKLKESK